MGSTTLRGRAYRPPTPVALMDRPPAYPRLDRTPPVDRGRFTPWQEAVSKARQGLHLAAETATTSDEEALVEASVALFAERHARDVAFMRGFTRGTALAVEAQRPHRRHVLATLFTEILGENPDDDIAEGLGAGLLDAARRADEFDAQLAEDLRRTADRTVQPGGMAS